MKPKVGNVGAEALGLWGAARRRARNREAAALVGAAVPVMVAVKAGMPEAANAVQNALMTLVAAAPAAIFGAVGARVEELRTALNSPQLEANRVAEHVQKFGLSDFRPTDPSPEEREGHLRHLNENAKDYVFARADSPPSDAIPPRVVVALPKKGEVIYLLDGESDRILFMTRANFAELSRDIS